MTRQCVSILLFVIPLLILVPTDCFGLSVPPRSSATACKISRHALLKAKVRGGGDADKSPSSAIPSLSKLSSSVSYGYRARVAADPNFLLKSVLEVALAAGTQFAAELNRRGSSGIITEIDFVVAGVLTAIAGKYYSAWRVAPTAKPDGDTEDDDEVSVSNAVSTGGFWSNVPTNAFQPFNMDGVTRPTVVERLAALLAPIPTLFRAGVIASAIGYGLTSMIISLRTLLVPDYTAQTVNVNIVHACLYTGAFMSIVSNIRYQLLQGVVEPNIIDKYFRRWPPVRAALTFGVRLANGLLGSMIAIFGMKWLGLQKLKS